MTRHPRRHTLTFMLATAVLLAGAATPVLAQDGAYIVEPWSGHYFAVKIQPGDQKIVAAGLWEAVLGEPGGGRVAIARYDSLGNADPTYGSGGLANPELGPSVEYANDLVLQPDGKAVVAGSAYLGGNVVAVARFNANGSLDAGFGSGGWNSLNIRSNGDEAYAVGLQSSGKVVAAGWSYNSPSSTGSLSFVARFTTAGTIDAGTGGFGQLVGSGKNAKPVGYITSSFGGPYQHFTSLVVQPDDKIVAVGLVTYSNGAGALVARYTAEGKLDTTFNSKGSSKGYYVFAPAGADMRLWGVALQSDGKIVAVGSAPGIDGREPLVARFNANGTLDTSFGGGNGFVQLDVDAVGSAGASAIAIQPDGKIVAVGTFTPPDVLTTGGSVMVARVNANGTPDTTFGTNGIKLGTVTLQTGFNHSDPDGVALLADGTIIVAGAYFSANTGSAHQPLLMRFDP